MSLLTEKARSMPVRVADDIEQLRLDVEKNAVLLTQYAQALQEQPSATVSARQDPSQWHRLLNSIANAPADLLRRLRRHVRSLARKFLPHWHQALWTLPRVRVGDVIHLEDALGRHLKLPFEYFAHWAAIPPYLAYLFRGLPGEYQIRNGQYRMSTGYQQFIHKHNWSTTVQPGKHVTMSVLSTVPFEEKRILMCPFCNSLNTKIAEKHYRICRSCTKTYEIHKGPLQRHVQPSDGDRNSCSYSQMTERQTLTFFREMVDSEDSIWIYRMPTSFASSIKQPDESSSQYMPQNLGMSQLKHVTIHTTHNLSKVTNAIEDLIEQLSIAHPDPTFYNTTTIRQLRDACTLIHNEARRVDQLNYLRFKREHDAYMAHAKTIIGLLEKQINALQRPSSSGTTNTTTSKHHALLVPMETVQIKHFTNWVRNHYPPTFHPRPDNDAERDVHQADRLIIAKTLTGAHRCYRVPRDLTIHDLKEMICRSDGLPPHQQYLIYNGRRLYDQYTVGQYGLGPKFYVHILLPVKWVASLTEEEIDDGNGGGSDVEYVMRAQMHSLKGDHE